MVEVFNWEIAPRFAEDFRDPTLGFLTGKREVFALLMLRDKKGVNVFLEYEMGLHARSRVNIYHERTWQNVPLHSEILARSS